jgi:YD repeat-containing protein
LWSFVAALTIWAALPEAVYGATVTYEHDPATGRLSKATYDNGTVVDYTYDANGNRTGAIVTTAPNGIPTAPGTPTFSNITMVSATASWTAATDDVGVTGYEYRLNSGSWQSLGNVLTVNLTGLSAATSYTFQVRAKDAASNIGPASSGTFTTPDTAAPSAPGTPTFSSITMTSATASWSAATDNVGVTGYEYRLNSGSWQSLGNVLTVNLTGLSASTSYTLQVRAKDAASNIGPASSGTFTTPDTAAPSAPGTPTFSSITKTTATASWSAATDNVGVTGYEYRLNGGAWQSLGNVLSVNLSGLSVGTAYTFEVRARDAAGNRGPIKSGSFTTLANITISNRTVHTQQSGGTTATYSLTAAGDIAASQATSSATIDVGDWLAPKVGMSGFQARATLGASGPCSSGPMGTWVGLGSAVTWTRSVSGPLGSSLTCVFTLEIRHSSNPSVILGTAQITIVAVNAS